VTEHDVATLPDGRRKYSNYTTYTPIPTDKRKYGVNKPDVPGAVRWGEFWLLPLVLLPEESRVMPQTRPDTDAYEHAKVTLMCRCEVCVRPGASEWRRKWRAQAKRLRSA
jgi:hypothetical protein